MIAKNRVPYLWQLVFCCHSALRKLLNLILHESDFDTVQQFRHPSCLMKGTWLLKCDGLLGLLATKEEHTQFKKLTIIIVREVRFG